MFHNGSSADHLRLRSGNLHFTVCRAFHPYNGVLLPCHPGSDGGCAGISKALAEGKYTLNIVNIRDFATDKYKSVDDLKNVSGIGEKTFEKLKEYIEN